MEKSFRLRAWTKADIPALAKYLNNKKFVFLIVTGSSSGSVLSFSSQDVASPVVTVAVISITAHFQNFFML